MMSERIKEAIDRRLASLKVTDTLRRRVLTGQDRRSRCYRRLSIPAAVLLVLLAATTAAAAPAIAHLLSMLGEEYEPILQPVSGVISEDCGVRMEVLAALNDAEYMEIYVKMTDLEGDRLEEDMRLAVERIDGARGWVYWISALGYDEAESAVYFKLEAERLNPGAGRDPETVSFTLHDLLGQRSEHRAYILNDALSEAAKLPPFVQAEAQKVVIGERVTLLEETQEVLREPAYGLVSDALGLAVKGQDWLTISNMGFIDGKLHVQTRWDVPAENFGWVYLAEKRNTSNRVTGKPFGDYKWQLDADGARVRPGQGQGATYREDIFTLPADAQLADYLLMADFEAYRLAIPGTWQATVTLEPHYEARSAVCDVTLASGSVIKEIELTPLGLTIKGSLLEREFEQVKVTLSDGSYCVGGCSRSTEPAENETVDHLRFHSRTFYHRDGQRDWHIGPWPIEEAVSVTIGGVTIPLT